MEGYLPHLFPRPCLQYQNLIANIDNTVHFLFLQVHVDQEDLEDQLGQEDQEGHRDQSDQEATVGLQDLKETLVLRDPEVPKDKKETEAQEDHKDQNVPKDKKENEVQEGSEDQKEIQDLKDHEDHKVQQDHQAQEAQRVTQVQEEPEEWKDKRVRQDRRVKEDHKGQQDLKDQEETMVQPGLEDQGMYKSFNTSSSRFSHYAWYLPAKFNGIGSWAQLFYITVASNLFQFTTQVYTYFQWTEDRQGFQIQYLTLDTWLGIIIFFINSALTFLMRNFWVKYEESSVGFENLAYLQSIENKCNSVLIQTLNFISPDPEFVHHLIKTQTFINFILIQGLIQISFYELNWSWR